jgi:hypothetical protein
MRVKHWAVRREAAREPKEKNFVSKKTGLQRACISSGSATLTLQIRSQGN